MSRIKLDIDGVIVYDSGSPITPPPPPIPPTPPPSPPTGNPFGLNPKLMMNLPHIGSSFGAYSFNNQRPKIGQEALYFFEIPQGRKPTQLEFQLQTTSPGGTGDFEMWVTNPAGVVRPGMYQHTPLNRVPYRDGTAFPVLVGYYLIKIIMHAGSQFLLQSSFKPEESGPYPWEFTTRLANTKEEATAKIQSREWLTMWMNGYPNIYV